MGCTWQWQSPLRCAGLQLARAVTGVGGAAAGSGWGLGPRTRIWHRTWRRLNEWISPIASEHGRGYPLVGCRGWLQWRLHIARRVPQAAGPSGSGSIKGCKSVTRAGEKIHAKEHNHPYLSHNCNGMCVDAHPVALRSNDCNIVGKAAITLPAHYKCP